MEMGHAIKPMGTNPDGPGCNIIRGRWPGQGMHMHWGPGQAHAALAMKATAAL